MRITWHRKLLIWATLSLLFVFILGSKTFAITEFKLLASDGAAGDRFGDSSFISGDVALVGASGDDDKGTNSGSSYVFRWNGSNWVQEQKLLASDGAAGDGFGSSVSISGDVALVGASGDDDKGTNSGSSYVFRWNGSNWVQEQKLLASDGAAGDGFGGTVSISGDVALVGAQGDDDKGNISGSAYVFRWNGSNWVQEQKLLASDGAADDNFGDSVSISGDVALVGASEEEKGSQLGKAYVFRWNGSSWVEEQKLLASDRAAGDTFGDQVSISGDLALVGASQSEGGDKPGKAYVFRWNGSSWVQEQKLLASDGAADDFFGVGAFISGDVALVGASGDDEDPAPIPGKVYVFSWNGSTWVEEQKLLASDGALGDDFGGDESVSFSGGDVALVGASGDDDKGTNSGSAYVYAFDEKFAYTPVTPCRIVDTRKAGGAISPGGIRSYNVRGAVVSQGGNSAGCPSPKGEPRAVHVNVTAVPLGNGNIVAYPFSSTAPNASLVNYRTDAQNVANSGTIKTCYNCAKDINIKSNFGSAHVVIDVLGYYYAMP